MTTAFAQAKTSEKARARRRHQEAQVAAAPEGSALQVRRVLNWLQAEVANGADLGRLVDLARELNGTGDDWQ